MFFVDFFFFQKDQEKPLEISEKPLAELQVLSGIEEPPSTPTPPPPPEDGEDEDEEDEGCLKSSILPNDNLSSLVSPGGSTFDYLYEFSETRKVLEEFFKCPPPTEDKDTNINDSSPFQVRRYINE